MSKYEITNLDIYIETGSHMSFLLHTHIQIYTTAVATLI